MKKLTKTGSVGSIVDFKSCTSYNFFHNVPLLKKIAFIALCVFSLPRYLVIVCLF